MLYEIITSVFSGNVSVSDWAQVLESVLRLDLPWRTLRPHLARLAPDGSVEYKSCFEDMESGIPLPQVREVNGSLKCILGMLYFKFIPLYISEINVLTLSSLG